MGLCIALPNSKVKNIFIILDESDFIDGNFRNIYDVYFYDSHCLMIMKNATRNITIKQFYVFFLNHGVKIYSDNRLCFFNGILFLISGF